jgi:hypothetical protein
MHELVAEEVEGNPTARREMGDLAGAEEDRQDAQSYHEQLPLIELAEGGSFCGLEGLGFQD